MIKIRLLATVCILFASATASPAGEADVVQVELIATKPDVYRISVSVLHQDKGWDHYADRWEVLAPDGRLLATRILYHPHVDEQPFTRRLDQVKIPAGIRRVEVRAHCSVHETGGKSVWVTLPDK